MKHIYIILLIMNNHLSVYIFIKKRKYVFCWVMFWYKRVMWFLFIQIIWTFWICKNKISETSIVLTLFKSAWFVMFKCWMWMYFVTHFNPWAFLVCKDKINWLFFQFNYSYLSLNLFLILFTLVILLWNKNKCMGTFITWNKQILLI